MISGGAFRVNWIKLGLAQTLLAASGPALAQSQWTYVSEVNYPNSADQFIAQVDASSMAVVGGTVRYWLRIVRIDTSSPDPIGPA